MSKSLPMGGFEWIDPVKFSLEKYDENSLKGRILEADFRYLKWLHELYNDYIWASDKLETKRKISDYQLKIADDYNITM